MLERGGCAFVRGPAGIGKTALLARARELATVPVLSARGSELETAFAFGGVQQLLGSSSGDFHELYWLLADRCPAVLLVDDAHWLDRPSLRWLAFMVNRVADLPLAIVLAARDEPLDTLTRIAVHDATTVLEPQPLSQAAVAELGGDFEATGGNPFYVHALLAAGDGTPRSVIDSIALRLEALPSSCLRLARALAVLDGMASGTVAARVASLDVRSTVEAFEALSRADIVRGEDFAHPLVRAAVYEAIPARERADLHAVAARLLSHPEHVAAQLMAAGPGLGAWTVEPLREAARLAWARGAPDEAATLLRRAAEEAMPRAQHAGVARELAHALVASAGPDGLPALREALALAEPQERAALSLELGRALFAHGHFAEACTALEAGLSERGTKRPDGGAFRSSELEIELATVAVLDLSLVRRFGGLDAIGARLPGSPVRAWIEVARDPAADGARHAEDALAQPLEPSGIAAALVALQAAGRYERADVEWSGVAETARAAGELHTLRMAIALRAMVRLRMGRVADVEADLRGLIEWVAELELPLRAYRTALPSVVSPLVDALIERGQLEEAGHWPALTGLEDDLPEEFGFTFMLDTLARLRLAQGRVQDALRHAREAQRRQRAWGFKNPGFIACAHTLATALHASGRTSEALDACDEQVDRARAFGARREHGMALRTIGEITRSTETLEAAVDILGRSEARLEHARALTALGGREHLKRALDIAERLGATALAETARRALIDTGARPRRSALTGVASLTAAQRRVARLAAEGRSNREIAETLFLTEKTVEGHLGAAYRKLGIGSRAQLRSNSWGDRT